MWSFTLKCIHCTQLHLADHYRHQPVGTGLMGAWVHQAVYIFLHTYTDIFSYILIYSYSYFCVSYTFCIYIRIYHHRHQPVGTPAWWEAECTKQISFCQSNTIFPNIFICIYIYIYSCLYLHLHLYLFSNYWGTNSLLIDTFVCIPKHVLWHLSFYLNLYIHLSKYISISKFMLRNTKTACLLINTFVCRPTRLLRHLSPDRMTQSIYQIDSL